MSGHAAHPKLTDEVIALERLRDSVRELGKLPSTQFTSTGRFAFRCLCSILTILVHQGTRIEKLERKHDG